MITVLIAVMLLTACAPQSTDHLPTLAVIPTDTPSNTPTITRTPTVTLTRTATLTRTLTPTITLTPSRTYTPSSTPLPTNTKPPSLTPSNTPTNTLIPSLTYTPSLTPLPSATHTPRPPTLTYTQTVLPQIIFFSSDLVTGAANSQTNLRWQTNNAASVTLEQLNSQGQVVAAFNVPPTGQQAIVLTNAFGSQVSYRLSVRNGRNTASQVVNITILCGNPYFFNPAPEGCSLEGAIRTTLTFQSFERGMAFYAPNTRTVYLLSNNGSRVNAYPMDWDYQPLPILPPPPGLIQPTGEIGYIFAKKTWSDGSPVVNTMGWATTPQQGYEGTIQRGTPTDVYIRRPDGAVYKLALAGTGTWTVVGTAP